ncbi:MAG: hypothetical protein HYV63_23035 [Candidatus Schekmanbacteria bacterium]|nr:hypothetical protein [Candidatus Schekmanbacteria bacterium]
MSVLRFRDRLLDTLRLVRPLLDVPDVLVLGSQVPNLLEPDAASTLVVSLDVDIGVPVDRHETCRRILASLSGVRPSPEEPSVWLPEAPGLLEVNVVGIDRSIEDVSDSYVLADAHLPLIVFGPLSLLVEGPRLELEALSVPLPLLSTLALEKLLTERSGVKGERDLLVVAALLAIASPQEAADVAVRYRRLSPALRHQVRSNLALLSLLPQRPGMPDPRPLRRSVAALLAACETKEEEAP